MKAIVSVIVPTFQRSDKLPDAINSILNQSYKNVEIIVVDDNDPDSKYRKETEIVMNKYMEQGVIYLKQDKNKGACASRNIGIQSAQGEYIGFLDDDDIWLNNKLEKQLNVFENNEFKQIGIVFCRRYSFDLEGNRLEKRKLKLPRGWIFNELLTHNYISTPVALVKKRCFENVGLFDENFKSRQDHDMFLRICQKYQADFVDESLVGMLVHPIRISRNIESKIQGWKYFIQKWNTKIDKRQKKLLNQKCNLELGKIYYISDKMKEARKHFVLGFYYGAYKKSLLFYIVSFLGIKNLIK